MHNTSQTLSQQTFNDDLTLAWRDTAFKALIYFKSESKDKLMLFQTKSGQNKVRLQFVLGIRNGLPKQTFWKIQSSY